MRVLWCVCALWYMFLSLLSILTVLFVFVLCVCLFSRWNCTCRFWCCCCDADPDIVALTLQTLINGVPLLSLRNLLHQPARGVLFHVCIKLLTHSAEVVCQMTYKFIAAFLSWDFVTPGEKSFAGLCAFFFNLAQRKRGAERQRETERDRERQRETESERARARHERLHTDAQVQALTNAHTHTHNDKQCAPTVTCSSHSPMLLQWSS